MDVKPISLWDVSTYDANLIGVLRAFALHMGCVTDKLPVDLCAVRPLPPQAILAVHTEGDPAFNGMGRDYPAGYVDTDLGWWKALTGDDH